MTTTRNMQIIYQKPQVILQTMQVVSQKNESHRLQKHKTTTKNMQVIDQ